jgi:hypothetical protein
MAQPLDPSLLPDDPALEGGEWLYRRRGEVFGPVDSRNLAAMLYRGELEAGTPVSGDGDRWTPVGEVTLFRLHAKKAEAALRVQQEVTGARLLKRRRHRRNVVLAIAGAAAVVVGAGAAAVLLSPGRGPVSPLLEDFGGGLRIASARVVASAPRADADFVQVELTRPDAPPTQKHEARPSRPSAPPRGTAQGGDELVASAFDPGKIQAIVNREQRTLVPCFREEAARSADFRGQVPLEFAIGNDGRVVALWIDEPRFKDGPLRECLLRALASWRFDPFPGQRPTVQLAFSVQ